MTNDLSDGILELVVDDGDLINIIRLISDDELGHWGCGWESDWGTNPWNRLTDKLRETPIETIVTLNINKKMWYLFSNNE